jgi:hypothetical protein
VKLSNYHKPSCIGPFVRPCSLLLKCGVLHSTS